jgi:hypothetical protein
MIRIIIIIYLGDFDDVIFLLAFFNDGAKDHRHRRSRSHRAASRENGDEGRWKHLKIRD